MGGQTFFRSMSTGLGPWRWAFVCVLTRAVDPDYLNPDPDPAFGESGSGSNPDPDPDPGF